MLTIRQRIAWALRDPRRRHPAVIALGLLGAAVVLLLGHGPDAWLIALGAAIVIPLSSDSLARSPLPLPGGLLIGQRGQILKVMVQSGATALNVGDAVVEDFATTQNGVTKIAGADSTRRFGIAVTASLLAGDELIVCVEGIVQAIAGAAIAAGALVATSANAAGQTKTAAAGGGATNLGTAMTAAAGIASVYSLYMQKS